MQHTNASSVSSFSGSLIRKSSQKTYGRRGRAYAAVKEDHARDENEAESSKQQPSEIRSNGETRKSDLESASHNGVSASTDETERPMSLDSEEDPARNRKRSRLEVNDRLKTAPAAALSGMSTKRRRVAANDMTVSPPRLGPTKPVPRQVTTPSSDLSELSSESENTDVESTPKAVRQHPAPEYRKAEQETTKYQGVINQPHRPPTTYGADAKVGRIRPPAPITPPTSRTFLPAINSTTENSNGTQPAKFPARKKARMLSRAESFGRKEAQKDQQDPVIAGAVGESDQAVSPKHHESQSISTFAPHSSTIPTTPRRSLVRSSTLASLDISPSKQRGALARTSSMPLSPVKNSVFVSAQLAEPARNFGVPGNVIPPARRTYGKIQRFNSLTTEVISQPPPVTDEMGTQLSPIPQSSVPNSDDALSSPSRPLMESRESYAELVKRLEMDDEEELQDREELDGSMDYLRNAQSLAELRSKGENRKFMDDLTWLFDGLSDDVLSVRRSSAIDVLKKMSDPGWFDRLRICSQVEQIYIRLAAGRELATDVGSDLAFLEYLTYIARVPNALISILGNHRDSVIDFALHVLHTPSVTFNVTTTSNKRKPSPALTAVSTLRVSLGLTDAQNNALSADAMAMVAVSIITGHSIAGHIEPLHVSTQERLCAAIVERLRQCLKILPERMELFEKSLDLFPDGTDVDFAFIAEAVEALSVMRNAWPHMRARLESRHFDLATDLSNLLLVMQFVEVPLITEKQELACQLLVAPTLSSKSWCIAILKGAAPAALVFRLLVSSGCLSDVMDTTDSGRKSDDLVADEPNDTVKDRGKEIALPLGLLYNLMDVAENSGEALLLQSELSLNCSSTPLCLRQCRCNDRKTGVNLLCDVFNRQQDKRTDHPSAAFLAGYLTLLFTKVLDRRSCRDAILTFVQGPNQQDKLAVLQDCLCQFADVYESAQLRLEKVLPSNAEEGGFNANEEEEIERTIKAGLKILQSISLA
ncbi:hypothetical protein QFC22_001796 [Naganishia vaughanmartiniae]|uniref:Uncharacterized protein n=1 Tax=Naganishia vaughanmartiniae TaxID=1424756 RepID=A0ACC2XG06_9TREE|nr:hypothetical protein QFC22_001796 [Naganishia vaughanmartiniae]